MGKKLDALLGRTFKASKFKTLVGFSISRVAVLKHQHEARSKLSLSDVLQLLQLGHHERALLRVEHVIKEQNMSDVYDMIEGYCNILIERVHLIERQRECHEELKEAASGLVYAASRCGDFPELQEIRAVLTSHFGKEFAARATELRNNCGVNPEMIKKLSTRMPSLESRMKALKEIASENNIVLQLEEASSASVEEQLNITKQNQPQPDLKVDENLPVLPMLAKDEEFPYSLKAKQNFKDVADAAQAAFESAAYAAAAARAAMELSKSKPHDPDDQNSPSTQTGNVFDTDNSMADMSQSENKEITGENKGEQSNRDAEELDKPTFVQSSNSGEEILKDSTICVDAESESDPFIKELVFYEGDNKNRNKQNSHQFTMQGHHARSPLNLELKKPFSVRTRGVRGY